MLPDGFSDAIAAAVGAGYIRTDHESRVVYGTDALRATQPVDLVALPASAAEVSEIARLCNRYRVPLTPRGAGTGYSGGAVPAAGGVVLSLERLNQILEIDPASLLAVVQPHVVTADLQRAVEAVGLFYPPDPASLNQSVIGGNVAESAGGPRAFKYGTTKRYVLGLEAVLPTGELIRTGGKSVKNVVGYDLTQLLVGSEGTLAIVTQITLRLIPKPPARATLRVLFPEVAAAVAAVQALATEGVVPAALELIDAQSLTAVNEYRGSPRAADSDTLLLIEADGQPAAVEAEVARIETACRQTGATSLRRSATEAERDELWSERRDLSLALRALAPLKINHDVVVPKGRIPQLFETIERLRAEHGLLIPAFGHAGDGNIHVNILVDPSDADVMRRARRAEHQLFEAVVALEGSISGEHGIGSSKARFLGMELTAETIELMQRVKLAFDPNGILNPGKIFPDTKQADPPRNG